MLLRCWQASQLARDRRLVRAARAQPRPVARGAFRTATVWRTRSQQPGGASSNSQRPSGKGGAALPMMVSMSWGSSQLLTQASAAASRAVRPTPQFCPPPGPCRTHCQQQSSKRSGSRRSPAVRSSSTLAISMPSCARGVLGNARCLWQVSAPVWKGRAPWLRHRSEGGSVGPLSKIDWGGVPPEKSDSRASGAAPLKRRVLRDLERGGLITVERPSRKTPIVTLVGP
jgi:hypothetical protein